jgi:hypothetical protein
MKLVYNDSGQSACGDLINFAKLRRIDVLKSSQRRLMP